MARQPDPQEVAAAIAAYQAQTVELRAKLAAFIERLWRSLGSWRRPDIPQFLAQVLPVVLGAQRSMATLTAAHLAQQQQLAIGGLFAPVSIDPVTVTGARARNGADPRDVYTRPFQLVWRQLSELPHAAGSIDQAIEAGMKRAVALAGDDVQLTKVQTAQRVRSAPSSRIVGYRRVLEGAYSCGLCIVAATKKYNRGDLMPIHGGCDCSSAEIVGDVDPGTTIAATVRVDGNLVPIADLADIHDRLDQRFGASDSGARKIGRGAKDARGRILEYRDVLITHEHGELGTVLGIRGQPFTGPQDLAP